MTQMRVLAVGVALAAIGLASCAGQANGDAKGWYDGEKNTAPTSERVYICHGFGCTYRTSVSYRSRDLRRLRSILDSGRASPSAERLAISKAVQWQEKRVAGEVGSARDVGGLDLHNARVPGQMDCIDEATNTTSLLMLAQARGYLKHHTVGRPASRGFFLDGRYPHATATIKERGSGTAFAVDSWPHANGKPPDVLLLATWFSNGGA